MAALPAARVRFGNNAKWRPVAANGTIAIPPAELTRNGGTGAAEASCPGYFNGVILKFNDLKTQTFPLQPLESHMPPWWSKFCVTEPARATGSNVKIGIIDSGCGYHLLLRHVKRHHVIARGRSLNCESEGVADRVGHGTHIAGLIGARRNLSPPFGGLLPDAEIFSVRIMNSMVSSEEDDETTPQARMEAALTFLTESKVDVINISIRAGGGDRVIINALDDALDAGIVLVAAAGNSGRQSADFPACHRDVIAISGFGDVNEMVKAKHTVSCVRNAGLIADAFDEHNSYFKSVDTCEAAKSFWCPGVAIISTAPPDLPLPNNGFRGDDGTSFACGIATGIIGGIIEQQKSSLDRLSGRSKVLEITRILEERADMRTCPALRLLH